MSSECWNNPLIYEGKHYRTFFRVILLGELKWFLKGVVTSLHVLLAGSFRNMLPACFPWQPGKQGQEAREGQRSRSSREAHVCSLCSLGSMAGTLCLPSLGSCLPHGCSAICPCAQEVFSHTGAAGFICHDPCPIWGLIYRVCHTGFKMEDTSQVTAVTEQALNVCPQYMV